MSQELSDYHRLILLKKLPGDEFYSPCKAKEGYCSSLLKKLLREQFAVDNAGNPFTAPPVSAAEKIKASFEKLLETNLLGDHGLIDASKAELYHMGVSRDRIDARLISIWAKTHGYDISSGGGNNIKRHRGQRFLARSLCALPAVPRVDGGIRCASLDQGGSSSRETDLKWQSILNQASQRETSWRRRDGEPLLWPNSLTITHSGCVRIIST